MTAAADVFLRQMADGDPVGLERLYDRCAPAVYATAMRVLQDLEAAEDTVQEVFADAWYDAKALAARGVDAAEWLVAEAKSRAAGRLAAASALAPSMPRLHLPAHDVPAALRRRVLDSIYGAGQRLPGLYPRPRMAERIFGWLSRRKSPASPDRSEEDGI